MSPKPYYRTITKDQFKRGYLEKIGDIIKRRDYTKVGEDSYGNIIVLEPTVDDDHLPPWQRPQ